jgi:hypothetical protein
MRPDYKKAVIVATLLLLLAVPVVLGMRFYSRLPSAALDLGESLPTFQVQTIGKAEKFPSQGRRAILFFSPSCPFCEETIVNQLEQFKQSHSEWFSGNHTIKWSLVSVGTFDETNAFAEKASWNVYHDPERQAMKEVRAVGLPYLLLVDEQGHVQYRHNGMIGKAQQEALLSEFFATGQVKQIKIAAHQEVAK